MQIGTAIQRQRLKKGLTQLQLAHSCGIAQANLSNIEKGRRDLNLVTLRRIGFALDVPAWDLLRCAEEEAQRIPLTRKNLEGLAGAILDQTKPRPSAVSAELVKALRGLFSLERKLSDKALERCRVEALRVFNQKDLESIRARVNDERARQA